MANNLGKCKVLYLRPCAIIGDVEDHGDFLVVHSSRTPPIHINRKSVQEIQEFEVFTSDNQGDEKHENRRQGKREPEELD